MKIAGPRWLASSERVFFRWLLQGAQVRQVDDRFWPHWYALLARKGAVSAQVCRDLARRRLVKEIKDIWFGLVKAMSFGFAIGVIGCMKGLSVRRGAQQVGRATTEAVVLSAQMILVLDAFWAIVLL